MGQTKCNSEDSDGRGIKVLKNLAQNREAGVPGACLGGLKELSHEFNVCYATTHSNVFPFPNFHINFLNMSKNTLREYKNVFCRFSFVKFWHFHHPLLMRFSKMSIKKQNKKNNNGELETQPLRAPT